MSPSTIDIDEDLGEVTITRDYDAPRRVVFEAFKDPEQLAQFWGPVGVHTPVESIVIEPWVGGRFETGMVADDGSGEFPMKSVFVEFDEPEVFAFKEVDSDMV
ncbi:MAG TPA: SRPBCC domain-containing protein [Acidimicrobiales bacterium]